MKHVVRAVGLFVALAVAARQPAAAQRSGGASSCDAGIAAIASGYGADGSYAMDQATVANPEFRRQPATVFFPRGAEGKRPVVFLSHGFGPGVWEAYGDLIRHAVSRGYVVVYSTYPMLGATLDQRYDDLWAGFAAAAARYGDRLDLTRVAFVGHSFGGGATPEMAYRGIVVHGWGSRGALMFELAPWYALQITDAQLRAIPARVVQAAEVYDRDDTNDPRMAIDLHEHSPATDRYFFRAQSTTVRGCTITADHSTPARNASLRQKQYGVFRPLDALMDFAFGNAAARDSLAAMGSASPSDRYQPLRLESRPVPADSGRSYQNPWNSPQNSRGGPR